ncbi:Ubiquinone biosynthesis protein coq9, mitochondrial [Puttea exsequens]|nr:Ubiquinone biosynthesis protein coq9, mitochondrial [Puttea exsequens]
MASLRPRCASLKQPSLLRKRLIPPLTRPYHSYEHEQPPPFDLAEERILSAALSHVPSHGFTATALTKGAREAGYLDVSTNLFPAGAFAIVKYHLVSQRRALAKHAAPVTERPNVPANIKSLALKRLHANTPIIHHWQSALAQLSTPKNLSTSFRELGRLSDELLFLAGSTTVSSAWYTDRAAVAAIYASAELFMTTDKSKDFVETEEFLTRRLDEGETVRGVVRGVGGWIGMQAGGLLDGLRSKGVWI